MNLLQIRQKLISREESDNAINTNSITLTYNYSNPRSPEAKDDLQLRM